MIIVDFQNAIINLGLYSTNIFVAGGTDGNSFFATLRQIEMNSIGYPYAMKIFYISFLSVPVIDDLILGNGRRQYQAT
jgi:hypothetical protein